MTSAFLRLLQVHKEQYASAAHNSSHLFDVHPLTGVNLDTYVKQSGLNLVHGERYRVVVIATDEAGGCVYTSGVVTVDTTPPLDGHVGVGPETHLVSVVCHVVAVTYVM